MKKASKLGFALLALAAGALLAEGALAHGRGVPRVSFGFSFGVPYYAPFSYYSPFYYYPAPVYYSPPVVVQRAPNYYVERQDYAPPAQPAPSAATPAQNYWYYCGDSRTYYPYVKECPGGWQRVSPTPQ